VSDATTPTTDDAFAPAPPIYIRTWTGLVRALGPTCKFLLNTEAHVYAFSIAANVLLSFFPFLLTIVLLCRSVLHWEAGVRAILFAVSKCFPDYHNGSYIDIAGWLIKAAQEHGPVSVLSLLLLFFTANGIFQPLEVALNRAWRVDRNRSYFKNQLVSLGLIFLCGALMLIATVLIADNGDLLAHTFPAKFSIRTGKALLFKLVTVPVFTLIIFAVYWILPNRRIPARRLIPAAIFAGVSLSVLNYLNLLTWPWLLAKLKTEVGPFVHSASILVWSFVSSLVVLAGAEWSARVTLSEELVEGDKQT
jgi:uncharacterized BrkB/YihY/UPF0761 family membrane protein